MSVRPTFWLLAVVLVLAGRLASGGPPATDRLGDPLPAGAVARLGTERLSLANAVFLTFSADGRRLAAHNGHTDLRVWDVASGKELLRRKTPRFRGYGSGMRPLAFSPDGKALALGCADNSIRIWEVATGKESHRFGGLPRPMTQVAFTPDGRSLLAGGYSGPIRCWALPGGGAPRTIGDFKSVAFLAVSRDGKTVTGVTGDRNDWRQRTAVSWGLATGKERRRHAFTTMNGWAGALAPEGDVFAAPDTEGKSIALLDPLTGRERARGRGSKSPVLLTFSRDGTAVACSSDDGIARVWDTVTGKQRARFKALPTSFYWLALSPGGKLLALRGRADHAIHLWDVAKGRELHSFPGHRSGPLEIAFVGDGKEVATVSRDSSHVGPYVKEWADWSFRRWDAATGAERAVIKANPKGEVYLTAFSADGRRLVTVIHDGTLRLWDVEAGKEVRTWKVPILESKTIYNYPGGKQEVIKTPHPAISRPAFTPDGKVLVAAAEGKVLRWDVATGKELPSFAIAGVARYAECAPAPDGRTLAVSSWGATRQTVLLDLATGKVRRRLEGVHGWMCRPRFSPDGRTLAVDEAAGVSLWEVAGGRSRGLLASPRATAVVAFSPDGRLLAGRGNRDGRLHVWDLATGAVVGRLHDELGTVDSIAFSPDGSRLALAGYAPTALVCDVAALCGVKDMKEIVKRSEPAAAELDGLLADLAGADGARAYRAIRRLGAAGARGARLLKKRLEGAAPPDERPIARLVADLDSDTFETRERATEELKKLGARAEEALRRALAGKPSAEVRARVKDLLKRRGPSGEPPPSPELVRVRVVEALEANGTPEARKALAGLAAGPADMPLTREAKASLARLGRRGRKP